MKRGVIGAVTGLVFGVAIGASVVAPRLNGAGDTPSALPDLRLGATPAQTADAAVTIDGIQFSPLTKTPPPEKELAKTAEPEADTPPKQPEAEAVEKPVEVAEMVEVVAKILPEIEIPPEATTPPEAALLARLNTDAGVPGIRLRMESAFSPVQAHAAAQARRMAEDVRRISAGMIDIAVFNPGQLVEAQDLFNAVVSGTLDAGFASPGLWVNRIPALALFSGLPFGPMPDEHLAWFFTGGGAAIYDEIYAANGLKGIVCGIVPSMSSGWFARNIKTVEAFRGMKIRITGMGARVLETLGATIVEFPDGEAVSALEAGEIDGAVLFQPTADLALGAHKAAKHYYFPGWQQPTRLLDLIVNQTRWDALTSLQRAHIQVACGDNLRYGLTGASAGEFAALMKLSRDGVDVRRWPGPVLDGLEGTWAGVRDDLIRSDKTFRKGWESLSRFREDYAIWRELTRP